MESEQVAEEPVVDAFERLRSEHVWMLKVADAVEVYGQMLVLDHAPAADLVRFCTFFREYGSMIHHEKEERIAFAALSLHGFAPGAVPRAQLHEEHEKEHAQLLHLIRYALHSSPLEQIDRERIAALTSGYATYLRTHLSDEEKRLYPALRETLDEAELSSVARKLARFDEEHNMSGQLDWLMDLATELANKYPSRPRSVA